MGLFGQSRPGKEGRCLKTYYTISNHPCKIFIQALCAAGEAFGSPLPEFAKTPLLC